MELFKATTRAQVLTRLRDDDITSEILLRVNEEGHTFLTYQQEKLAMWDIVSLVELAELPVVPKELFDTRHGRSPFFEMSLWHSTSDEMMRKIYQNPKIDLYQLGVPNGSMLQALPSLKDVDQRVRVLSFLDLKKLDLIIIPEIKMRTLDINETELDLYGKKYPQRTVDIGSKTHTNISVLAVLRVQMPRFCARMLGEDIIPLKDLVEVSLIGGTFACGDVYGLIHELDQLEEKHECHRCHRMKGTFPEPHGNTCGRCFHKLFVAYTRPTTDMVKFGDEKVEHYSKSAWNNAHGIKCY